MASGSRATPTPTRSPSSARPAAPHHHHTQSSGGSTSRAGGGGATGSAAATESVSKAVAQYTLDAGLHAVFEQSGASGRSFDYSQSLLAPPTPSSEQQIAAYLSRIQRGGHIQPFGCTLAVADDSSFRLLAFSENAADLLDLSPHHSVPSLDFSSAPSPVSLGSDARLLFVPSSGVLLERAFAAREISLLNPLWIHSRVSSKPFYAILHRIDVGVVIDLEPARTEDPALSIAGAVQSQKLAVRAISCCCRSLFSLARVCNWLEHN